MPYRHGPTSLALSSSEETEVVSLTEKVGLDSTEFRWSAQPSRYYLGRLVSVLVHIPTGASFRFEFIESALARTAFRSSCREIIRGTGGKPLHRGRTS